MCSQFNWSSKEWDMLVRFRYWSLMTMSIGPSIGESQRLTIGSGTVGNPVLLSTLGQPSPHQWMTWKPVHAFEGSYAVQWFEMYNVSDASCGRVGEVLCPPSYMPTSSPCLWQLTAQHQSGGTWLLLMILYLMGEFFLIPAWLDLSMLILLCPHRTITMGKPQRGSRYSQSPIFPHVKAPVSTSANDTKSLFTHSKVCMQYNGLKCTMSLTHHVAVRACLRPGMCYVLVFTELWHICGMDTQGDKSLLDAWAEMR